MPYKNPELHSDEIDEVNEWLSEDEEYSLWLQGLELEWLNELFLEEVYADLYAQDY